MLGMDEVQNEVRLRQDQKRGREGIRPPRIAWTLWRGPIPEGLCVLHRCDNPPCFNPDHLFLGSQAENVVDRDEKGRGAHGSRNGNAKISDAEIDEIIRSSGTQAAIAKRFGITQPHVSRIRSGKRRV